MRSPNPGRSAVFARCLDGVRQRLSSRAGAQRTREEARPAPRPRPNRVSDLLAGRHAIVTGAGRNIGRATVVELLAAGAQVTFTDRDADRCAALERELEPFGDLARGYVSDVSKPDDNARLIDLLATAEPVDILVNNAGVQAASKSLFEFDRDEYLATYDSNVVGPVDLTRRVAGQMRARSVKGSIIFVLSLHAWTVRRVASYSASKAALTMIVRELAVDLAPYGIRVNGIAPGWVWEADDGQPIPHAYTLLHRTTVPPAYIGRAACVLASEFYSGFTTGAIHTIDGGLSLFNHILAADPGLHT